MTAPSRMTRKAAASIVFGFGSFLLMADMVVAVLRNGDKGEDLFEMGFPGIIAYFGMLLWLTGIIILVLELRSRRRRKAGSVKPVFLHGRSGFRCVSCGKRIDGSRVNFHERIGCSCGKLYDVYEGEGNRDP